MGKQMDGRSPGESTGEEPFLPGSREHEYIRAQGVRAPTVVWMRDDTLHDLILIFSGLGDRLDE